MFRKILIANRGEIACRIIRTARRMGIATVAVCSEADRAALHVRMADESVTIGAAPAADSYLSIERIVAACRATGAEAVHPGYGFLSERPDFARALTDAGIVFIGPDAAAMEKMGDKLAAKRIAAAAGVSTVPGHAEAIGDAEDAVRIACAIGYPVMLKAAAGGGGKGMRIAADDAGVRAGMAAVRREARSSFGDDRVLIEKFVPRPRHIEIQVLADGHGTVLSLGERECSLQRRHQKVIEEAPSPFLDAPTRARMAAQAVALTRAVGYRSAGTVEFIVDAARNFWFLEMNTRLQVEHPVTELVTGLDLVEWMIRIAAGERLTLRQEEIVCRGAAIEARLYAEDPSRGFAPSPGRLRAYQEPPCAPGPGPGLRIDSGVAAGDAIPVFYDPMIAKLCAHGDTREAAAACLRAALDAFVIRGIAHNLRFLSALLNHPRVAAGDVDTALIADVFPDGPIPDAAEREVLLVAAALIHVRDGARRGGAGDGAFVLRVGATECAASVTQPAGSAPALVLLDGKPHRVLSAWQPGETMFRGLVDGGAVCAQVLPQGLSWRLGLGGTEIEVSALPPRVAELARRLRRPVASAPAGEVRAPMAGRLVAVRVSAGESVDAGALLAVIEAMKMESNVLAPRAGTVVRVAAAAGAMVTAEQVLVVLA
jgi:propionyl-CoA carboxylase alpha chain